MRSIIAHASFFLIFEAFASSAAPVATISPAVWSEGSSPGQLSVASSSVGKPALITALAVTRAGDTKTVWTYTLSSGSTVQLPTTPFSTAGFYRLVVTDGTSATTETTASVIARPLARIAGVPLFGVNTHFSQRSIPDSAYSLLVLGNVDLIRDQWAWSQAYTVSGGLKVPTSPNGGPAHQGAMLAASGIRILNNCAKGNSAYDGGQFPTSSTAVAAYAKYCSLIASAFGSTLYGSEIWNEPTVDAVTEYAPLVKVAAEALRTTEPGAQVLQGAGGGPGGGANPSYEIKVYNTLGSGCCSGASIHPYMTNPDVGYLALTSGLTNPVSGQRIVNLDFALYWLDYVDHLFKKPNSSSITEIGWPVVSSGNGVSEEKQAAFISRTLIRATKPTVCTLAVGAKLNGVAKECSPTPSASSPDLQSLFVYDFQNDGTDPSNAQYNYGLVHSDLTPKMAFSAYAQAAGLLRGAGFVKSFSFGSGSLVNGYLYRTGTADGLLVLWTSEFAPAGIVKAYSQFQYQNLGKTQSSVTLSGIDTSSVHCSEWDGASCDATTNPIQVSNLPVYLRVHGSLDNLVVSEVAQPMSVTDLSVAPH